VGGEGRGEIGLVEAERDPLGGFAHHTRGDELGDRCERAEVRRAAHQKEAHGRLAGRGAQRLEARRVSACRGFDHEHRRRHLAQPGRRAAHRDLVGVGAIERRAGRAVPIDPGDRPEGEDGAHRRPARGDEQRQRPAGAVPAEVDARRVDVRALAQIVDGREHVIDLAEKVFTVAGIVVAAAQRGQHLDEPRLAECARALVVRSRRRRPGGVVDSPIEASLNPDDGGSLLAVAMKRGDVGRVAAERRCVFDLLVDLGRWRGRRKAPPRRIANLGAERVPSRGVGGARRRRRDRCVRDEDARGEDAAGVDRSTTLRSLHRAKPTLAVGSGSVTKVAGDSLPHWW